MDYCPETDEDSIDLSKYTTIDSCLWLLNRLRINEHEDNPYSLPFLSYVMTWHKAVPLTCIIMAQNPYPQNVYPPIAAAMSYDTELAKIQVKRRIYQIPVPPTVHIFANDMYINAGIKKEDTINILKNGWALVDRGILLVNEGVFTSSNNPEYYDESSNQCNVIIRLLQETELYGSRTVDVYGLGEAGQRMASNLCSWYKSSTIRLSKHTATHPAALSRRFNNFDHPDCHMNTPSFSKSLAKHFSNHVAYIHTMAKRSEADIKIQQYADLIRTCSVKFTEYEKDQINFNKVVAEIRDMDLDDKEKVRETFSRLYIMGNTLATRAGVTGSALQGVQRIGGGVSNHVSKAGPSLQNPSPGSLNSHVGQDHKPVQQLGMKANKITLTKSKNSTVPTRESSFTQVSAPPSVKSIQSGLTPTKIKLTKSKSTNSTPVKSAEEVQQYTSPESVPESTIYSTTSNVQSNTDPEPIVESEKEEPRTKSSLSAHFRKNKLAVRSNNLDNSGQQNSKPSKGSALEITPAQRDQLSAVEAVVQVNKSDADDDEDCIEKLEYIQNDIAAMAKYNSDTVELVEAIDKDMKVNPKFDFVNWAVDNSNHSYTYEKCKEIFNF